MELTTAKVSSLPKCDFPHSEPTNARYDGKTVMGPWAFMCLSHFMAYGVGIGTGKGQELYVSSD